MMWFIEHHIFLPYLIQIVYNVIFIFIPLKLICNKLANLKAIDNEKFGKSILL